MLGRLKINTAILICSAFIFRLLFVNVGIISSLNTHQNNASVKKHFSSVMKRRKHFDPSNHPGNVGYSAVEILEEDSDNEDQFKANPFYLIHFIYSLAVSKTESNLKKIIPFYRYFTSSRRHLQLQVFRI